MKASSGERLWGYIFLAFGLIAPPAAIVLRQYFFSEFRLYDLALHSAIEGLGAAIAFITGILITAMRRHFRWSGKFRWVACALLSMGIISAVHALFGRDANSLVTMELAHSLVGGLLASLVWLPSGASFQKKSIQREVGVALAALVFAVFLALFPEFHPRVVENQAFTPLSLAISVVSSILFVSASIRFFIDYRHGKRIKSLYVADLLLLSGATFLPINFVPFGALWWSWHFIQFIGYCVAFVLVTKVAVRLGRDLDDKQYEVEYLVNHSPSAIAMFDREMRYIYANDNWVSDYELELKKDELIGKCHYEIFPDLPMHLKEIHCYCLSGKVARSESEPFRRRDGSTAWMRWDCRPWYNGEGGIGGVFVFSENITQKKQMELALEQTRHNLKRSNADLERFAHLASHDLQEPLRTVSAYLELLTENAASRLTPKELAFLESARSGAARMQELIQNILSFSKVSTIPLKASKMDVGNSIARVKENLSSLILSTGTEITTKALPVIESHPVLIEQVFQNLIGNAIKYRRDAPQIEVGALQRNGGWEFYVKDNGIGIPKADEKRIFDLFDRLHGDEIPGTGIGLAACKSIIHRLGGEIWVKSEEGIGSTFSFFLPGTLSSPSDPREHGIKSSSLRA